MPKDIRVEVKVRNNLILSKMEKKGIDSVAELCRQMGIRSSARLGDLINMKKPARGKRGNWDALVHKLAEFFQCMPEDLFSEPQQYNALKKNRAHAEVSYAEMQRLTTRRNEPLTPELTLQASELRQAITAALSRLTPREERVLRLRFGFETGEEMYLETVGDLLGVGKERIRQIEAKALWKLKHPSRSAKLQNLALKRGEKDWRGDVLDEEVLKAL